MVVFSATTVFLSVPSLSISTSTVSPGLSQTGGLRAMPDARRRAGEDQVARLQCEDLRQVGDQLVDAEDELAGARVLHGLAVQTKADTEILGVGDLVGSDQLRARPARTCRTSCRPSIVCPAC